MDILSLLYLKELTLVDNATLSTKKIEKMATNVNEFA